MGNFVFDLLTVLLLGLRDYTRKIEHDLTVGRRDAKWRIRQTASGRGRGVEIGECKEGDERLTHMTGGN